MNLPRPARAAATLALLVTASCATDADAPATADAADGWTVSERPTVVVADDGTPATQFSRVEARRLPSGEIVVGDPGTGDVHVFGRDGRVARRLARRGQGPGELPGAFRLVSIGDTVLALGQPPMSPPDVHLFTGGSGFVARTRPAAAGAGLVTVVDRLATGEQLVRRGMPVQLFWAAPEPGRVVPDTVTYGLLSGAADGSAGVAWLPPVVAGHTVSFPFRIGRGGTGLANHPLAPRMLVAASGDRVWIVRADSGGWRAFDGAAREVAAGRLPLLPRPWDRAQVERARDRALAAAPRAHDTASALAVHDPAHLPPTMPLVSDALAGPDGELWLRLFDLDDAAPQRWLVIDREGRELARVTLPASLEVQQVGRDFVLGVRLDDLGVPSVHEHALRRR